jgi:hypothetical protein
MRVIVKSMTGGAYQIRDESDVWLLFSLSNHHAREMFGEIPAGESRAFNILPAGHVSECFLSRDSDKAEVINVTKEMPEFRGGTVYEDIMHAFDAGDDEDFIGFAPGPGAVHHMTIIVHEALPREVMEPEPPPLRQGWFVHDGSTHRIWEYAENAMDYYVAPKLNKESYILKNNSLKLKINWYDESKA